MFGKTFSFTMLKQEKYKTLQGGIVTALCGVLVIVFAFFFGKDFFFKSNPRILQKQFYPDDYLPPFQMTPENFAIPFRLADEDDTPIDFKGKMYIRTKYKEITVNTSGTFSTKEVSIPIETCSKKYANMPELYNKYNISTWYCLDLTHDNYTFGGYWDGSYINYPAITLSFCPDYKPFSPNGNCIDKNTTRDLVNSPKGLYWNIMYPQFFFVPDDILNPLRISFKNYFFKMSLTTTRIDRLYFSQIKLYDDLGWLVPDVTYSYLNGGVNLATEIVFNDFNNYGVTGMSSQFYQLIIYSEKYFLQYNRSFMKFQELAAILGGFMKIIFVFGEIFCAIYNKVRRDNELYGQFFDYSGGKTKLEGPKRIKIAKGRIRKNNEIVTLSSVKKNKRKISEGGGINLNRIRTKSIGTAVFTHPTYKKEIYENKRIGKNLILDTANERPSLNFGLLFTCKRLCKLNTKTRDYKVYNLLGKFFAKRLDVVHYLEHLNLNEKVLAINYNKEQIKALNYFMAPDLDTDVDILQDYLDQDRTSCYEDVKKYFNSRIENKTLDNVDAQILNFISTDNGTEV